MQTEVKGLLQLGAGSQWSRPRSLLPDLLVELLGFRLTRNIWQCQHAVQQLKVSSDERSNIGAACRCTRILTA